MYWSALLMYITHCTVPVKAKHKHIFIFVCLTKINCTQLSSEVFSSWWELELSISCWTKSKNRHCTTASELQPQSAEHQEGSGFGGDTLVYWKWSEEVRYLSKTVFNINSDNLRHLQNKECPLSAEQGPCSDNNPEKVQESPVWYSWGSTVRPHSTGQGKQKLLLDYDRAAQPFQENGQAYLRDWSVWGGADIFGKSSGILKDRTWKQRAEIWLEKWIYPGSTSAWSPAR